MFVLSRLSGFLSLASIVVIYGLAALPASAAAAPVTCSGEPLSIAPRSSEVDLKTPPNSNGPTEVRAGLFVDELRDIDPVQSSYQFRGIVTVSWCDPRHAFDARVEGVEEKVFYGPEAAAQIERGWTARGFPVNQVDDLKITERVIRIRSDGMVSGDLNISVQLSANFDLRRFPFDSQQLTLEIESFTWNAEQVVMVADASKTGFSEDFEIPEWTITGVRAHEERVDVIRSAEPFSRFVLTIDIERKSGFYLWKVMLPLLIIVALSWSIFWMVDEKFGIRVRTSATGILTIVAFQFVASQNLPRVGYLTLIDKVMVISFLLLGVTVLESYVVSRYQASNIDRAHSIDRAARWFFPLTYASLIAIVVLGAPG